MCFQSAKLHFFLNTAKKSPSFEEGQFFSRPLQGGARVGRYPTLQPGVTTSLGVRSTKRPSLSSALSIIP